MGRPTTLVAELQTCWHIVDPERRVGRDRHPREQFRSQVGFQNIGGISDEECELAFRTNIDAMFHLARAPVANMPPGRAILNTASMNADTPSPHLLAYAMTKGAILKLSAGLAQMLIEKGTRAEAVAPGPVWTPLILITMLDDAVKNFGDQVPMRDLPSRQNLRSLWDAGRFDVELFLGSDRRSHQW